MTVLLRHCSAIAAILLLLFHFNSAQEPQPEASPELPNIASEIPILVNSYELVHFGDLINVDIVGSTEFDWRGELTPEGFLGGLAFTESPIYALCKAPSDLANEIKGSFEKFLNQPVVNVEILDKSKRPLVTLYGAVKQPQRFNLVRSASLKELIVLAGGFSENASGLIEIISQPQSSCAARVNSLTAPVGEDTQTVEQSVKKEMESQVRSIKILDLLAGNPNSTPDINYGDIITVVSAKPVYVIGNVSSPGSVSLTDGLTISRAISAVGGITGKKEEAKIRLFRRNLTATEVIEVLNGAGNETNPDTFVVKEYDIVEVFGGDSDRVKYPPVLRNIEFESRPTSEIPVRIVDRK